jgi:hypothetical protein
LADTESASVQSARQRKAWLIAPIAGLTPTEYDSKYELISAWN